MQLSLASSVEERGSSASKAHGFVPTPREIVSFLVAHAVKAGTDSVFDLGFGDARFLEAAATRLVNLGGLPDRVAAQLYGAELNPAFFWPAKRRLEALLGADPTNLYLGNLLDAPAIQVDAVIGNPPYVRRHHIPELRRWLAAFPEKLPSLTDLSALFVYRATQLLCPGGSLAVIVSSSWLDQGYGRSFRAHLLRNFSDISVIGFADRVFPGALVKPVALLATRKASQACPSSIKMTTVESVAALANLQLEDAQSLTPEEFVSAENLSSRMYLPAGTSLLMSHGLGESRFGDLGHLRIGFQSFAKDFFLLTAPKVRRLGLRNEDLRPIVLSPRWLPDSLTLDPSSVGDRVLCVDSYEKAHPASLSYILSAERAEVPVRGKGYTVTGYDNAPRLKRTNRRPWFNVADELDQRGGAPILLPRRSFVKFQVVHNPGRLPATEHFLEFDPMEKALTFPLLVYLNSTWGELGCRLASHQYGGGVFNLNPSQGRGILAPSPDRLAYEVSRLERAWASAASLPVDAARRLLDAALGEALSLPGEALQTARRFVNELRGTAKRLARNHTSAAAD